MGSALRSNIQIVAAQRARRPLPTPPQVLLQLQALSNYNSIRLPKAPVPLFDTEKRSVGFHLTGSLRIHRMPLLRPVPIGGSSCTA